MNRIYCIATIIVLFCGFVANSQTATTTESATPKTFIPYPQVPDTIKNLENRSNYFITHFWDKFDFSKQISDTDGFKSAFNDYLTFFRYAHRNIVKSSVSEVMNKAQSNMKNFWTFADAAEEGLYSPSAILQSDEAYILFINSILRSSKVKKVQKERYRKILIRINNSQVGNVAPTFDYVDLKGNKQKFDSIHANDIILFFNDPDCEDCNITRLRMTTNVNLNRLIDEKKVAVVSIYPGDYTKEWASSAKKYSDKWIIGAWNNADEIYDLRKMPTMYILNGDKKILTKGMQVDDLLNTINP